MANRIIERLKELAKGDQPSPRVIIGGHVYVPEVMAKHRAILLDVLDEVFDFLDSRADCDHDGLGYVPNEEMRLLVKVGEAISSVEVK